MKANPEIPSRPTLSTEAAERDKRMRRLAWLLDESVRLPGGLRIGVDGILGLIPGIGDISSAALSSYLLYEARAMGAPRSLLFRMGGNILIDTVIGAIPLVGDAFDFYWKANLRNMRLLRKFQEKELAAGR